MRKFKDIKIGEEFSSRTDPPQYPYKDEKVIRYRQTAISKAVCIAQKGFGNERQVGGLFTFYQTSIVY